MEAEGWGRIATDRFRDEDLQSYRERTERIADIVTGFRMGRWRGDIAERKERELIRLQEVGLERLSA